jgi:hypothetical protein
MLATQNLSSAKEDMSDDDDISEPNTRTSMAETPARRRVRAAAALTASLAGLGGFLFCGATLIIGVTDRNASYPCTLNLPVAKLALFAGLALAAAMLSLSLATRRNSRALPAAAIAAVSAASLVAWYFAGGADGWSCALGV